nr:type II secretion system F family protein [Shimazuella soli]
MFSYHLKTMLENGISLVESVQMITSQQIIPKKEGNLLIQMIQTGESFSAALQAIRLPAIFCAFIKAAEHHGDVLFALKQCHRYYLSRSKWFRKLKQVTFYPFFIFCSLCIGLIFLSLVILPTFSELFQSFSFELPYTTKLVFTLSRIFPYIFLFGFILLLFCIFGRRNPRFQLVMKRIPIITTYYRYRYTQYLSLQLGSFMTAGVPMLSTISLLEQVTPWPDLCKYLESTKRKLIHGATLSNIVQENSSTLLPIFSQTVILGEETGKLGEMLVQLSTTTEEWLTERLERWMAYLEPILTLSIGLIMAVVVISLFLPMFGLIQAVQ